jgi:phosphoserine phosphatase RsbU/P
MQTPELEEELRRELDEADALDEVVVLVEPTPAVLEAYTIEERLGVIAVIGAGGPTARAAALEAGALEVVDPAQPVEARARVATAVARFRSRLRLEAARDALDAQSTTLERDLRLAATLQKSLLPRRPELPGLEVATAFLPREFVSGDTWDLRRLDAEHVAFYTLDAVGHGVRAALLTMLLRAAVKPLDGARVRDPGEVLADLDRAISEADQVESCTAACCYGVLSLATWRVRLASAGHPLPVRLAAGASGTVGEAGLLLGVEAGTWTAADVALAPGDRLVLYTDGADPRYDGSFARELERHRDLQLMDQVGGALGASVALDDEGRPEDDVTVLALERRREGTTA